MMDIKLHLSAPFFYRGNIHEHNKHLPVYLSDVLYLLLLFVQRLGVKFSIWVRDLAASTKVLTHTNFLIRWSGNYDSCLRDLTSHPLLFKCGLLPLALTAASPGAGVLCYYIIWRRNWKENGLTFFKYIKILDIFLLMISSWFRSPILSCRFWGLYRHIGFYSCTKVSKVIPTVPNFQLHLLNSSVYIFFKIRS